MSESESKLEKGQADLFGPVSKNIAMGPVMKTIFNLKLK